MKAKAYINGIEVIVYGYDNGFAKCYIPEVGITDWFNMDLIEVRSE